MQQKSRDVYRFCHCSALAKRCRRIWHDHIAQYQRWIVLLFASARTGAPWNPGLACWAPHAVTELLVELWWQKWSPNSPRAIRSVPLCSLPCAVKNMARPWHLESRMCQAVSLHPCSGCFSLSVWAFGCVREREALCFSSMAKRAASPFILATLVLRRRVAWHHERSPRERRRENEGGRRVGRHMHGC